MSAAARERWVRAAGLRVHVREVGESDGDGAVPLLLVHGLGAHTEMWAPLERALLPGVRLISFDAPGVGRSPTPWPPPTIGMLAELVEGLLDELGLEKVDLLGYSLGGTVSQELARWRPARIRRLVLAATTTGWGCVPGRWSSLVHIYNPLRYFSKTYYEATIGAMAGGQARGNSAFIQQHAADRLAERPGLLGYYSQIAAVSSWTSIPWLDRIRVPTLVVTGDDDPLVPPVNSVMLARRIRRARLFVAPTEGHLLLFDDRGTALPVIRDFVTAPSLGQCAAWREAERVDAVAEAAALRGTARGLFPWGAVSAAYRAQFPVAARAAGS